MEITKTITVTITASERKTYIRFADICEEMQVQNATELLDAIHYGNDSYYHFCIKHGKNHPLPCDSDCIYITELEKIQLDYLWELVNFHFEVAQLEMLLDDIYDKNSYYSDSFCGFDIKYED